MPKALQNHVGDMFRILSGSINMRIVAADVISKLKESKRVSFKIKFVPQTNIEQGHRNTSCKVSGMI